MTTALAAIPLPSPPGVAVAESYPNLLARLSEMSVRKAHDPYRDVPWDEPDYRIETDDPRMRLWPGHALETTDWYRALDPTTQARFGVQFMAQTAKYAIGFEAVLSRGLLAFVPHVANGSPEYRYALHEVVEEGRHSLMFQELINRSGFDARPVTGLDEFFDDRIAALGRSFPELFFFAVLGGEIFIDEQNRELLRQPKALIHPLLRRVMQIHVTEEARHVCFAENYLREHLPACSRTQREIMAWAVPVIFAESKRMILQPDKRLIRTFGIPKQALARAYGRGSDHRRRVAATVEPVRQLCESFGMFRRRHARLWQMLGLIEHPR